MTTQITLSDGDKIRLDRDYDAVVTELGGVFRRDYGTETDDRGRIMQTPFLAVTDVNGNEIVINVSQIVSVRDASSAGSESLAEPPVRFGRSRTSIRDRQF